MDTPYCDIIGCSAHAQWFLVSELNGTVEEQYLCQRHWRQLLHEPARRIIRWSRAGASAPRSGGDTVAADQDHPSETHQSGGQAHT
jgi:hypothetical protein